MNPLKPEIAQAAGAAVRVGALCLAVVAFAAMWESDAQPARSKHWLAQRAEQRSRQVERGGIGHRRVSSVNHVGQTHAVTRQVSARESLPEEIAPGQYLVADNRGQVRRLRVTRSMTSSKSVEREQYVLRDSDATTYFIRVRTENGIARNSQDDQQRK